jgi:hypothetical protein
LGFRVLQVIAFCEEVRSQGDDVFDQQHAQAVRNQRKGFWVLIRREDDRA